VKAALTGHLVLSTLHTNDATGAIARLKDLGVPAFIINAALLGIMGQRLVRKNCEQCAKRETPDAALLARFGIDPAEASFKRGGGCGQCAGSGFRGRTGIYELLRLSPAVTTAIEHHASTQDLARIAHKEGMRPMWRDGLEKARMGITTLAEVGRTTMTIEAGAVCEEQRRLAA
jgi:type IV pilus assembly protein PilB